MKSFIICHVNLEPYFCKLWTFNYFIFLMDTVAVSLGSLILKVSEVNAIFLSLKPNIHKNYQSLLTVVLGEYNGVFLRLFVKRLINPNQTRRWIFKMTLKHKKKISMFFKLLISQHPQERYHFGYCPAA